MHIVKVLREVADDERWVGAFGENIQEVGGGHEVESWKGYSFGLQVVLRQSHRTVSANMEQVYRYGIFTNPDDVYTKKQGKYY